MRVLAVTNMYPSAAEPWYGCFVKEQMDAVRAAGVDVDILSFDGRVDRRAYLRAVVATRHRLRRGNFDVVHAHYGLSGAVAALQRRVPVVTTIWGSDAGYIRWQGRVTWGVARVTWPIFVSAHNARALRLPKATVISSGIDTAFFRPVERKAARRALGMDQSGIYVLFPGRRSVERKRPDVFDAAIAVARGVRSDILTLNLQGYTREQTRLVFSAVDAVLMTSDWEGSPLAVKEALACGTRVISVPVGDVSDVIAGLPGCAIAPQSPTSLAQALLQSLNEQAGSALRERALQFDQTAVAARVIAVYGAARARG